MSDRDAGRLDAIRALPCCCGCGRSAPSEAAHSNFSEHGKGRGIKAYDKWTIPLSRVCHQKFDTYQMGMSRNESIDWFIAKVYQTNEVLERGENDKSVF